MALQDSDPMPFGQYQGEEMQDVPASYLLWLYDNGKVNAAVKEYIEDNLDVLEEEVKRG